MAISFSVRVFLVSLTTATVLITSASEIAAPSEPPSPPEIRPSSPSTSPSAHAPPPPPPAIQSKQFRNILDALIGSGDYGNWANLLSSANPNSLPLTATLFVPSNVAISRLVSAATAGTQVDSLLIPYHIVPQRLSFSDLRDLATHTRLPTLVPSKFIVVTNNSAGNFAVDDSRIMQPDIFLNAAFALHGVDKVLNHSVFSSGGGPLSPPPVSPETAAFLRKKRRGPRTVNGTSSGAPRPCTTVSGIFSSFFILIFAFKIV